MKLKKVFAVLLVIGAALTLGTINETDETTLDNNEEVQYLGFKDLKPPYYRSK